MKKIEIEIPDDIQTKNSLFSHCLSFLKTKINNNNLMEGNLSPLGNTELISEKNLAWLISKAVNSNISESQLSYYIRDYNKISWFRLDPIKKYNKVSDTRVYLVEDTDKFVTFLIDKLSELSKSQLSIKWIK